MTTCNELIYMVRDNLKLTSNESLITDKHIFFLLEKYRAALLTQKYQKYNTLVAEENYSVAYGLPAFANHRTSIIDDKYDKMFILFNTKGKLMPIGMPHFYVKRLKMRPQTYYMAVSDKEDFYHLLYENNFETRKITLIPYMQFEHLFYSRYKSNIIYASILPTDSNSSSYEYGHLIVTIDLSHNDVRDFFIGEYLKDSDTRFQFILKGVFENMTYGIDITQTDEGQLYPLIFTLDDLSGLVMLREFDGTDRFPLEAALISPLIEAVTIQVAKMAQMPADLINNFRDDTDLLFGTQNKK